MSSCREDIAPGLSEQAWVRLAELETLHRAVQKNHERVIRSLDEATVSTDRRNLQIAWNQYRAVVADLGRVTEDIESLRLNTG
jgi:hypothetical protein